jgi:hypothetical protein
VDSVYFANRFRRSCRRPESEKALSTFTRSRSRKDKRGVDPIYNALPSGRLRYGDTNAVANAIGYAQFYSRSHDAVIRVYDQTGNVIETHEHAGDFKEW